uniref:Uncharacterized protein n=1 Tax=Ditylenchus dipsaci TaxID=166011 RepID=A0A915DAQ0_9BILA
MISYTRNWHSAISRVYYLLSQKIIDKADLLEVCKNMASTASLLLSAIQAFHLLMFALCSCLILLQCGKGKKDKKEKRSLLSQRSLLLFLPLLVCLRYACLCSRSWWPCSSCYACCRACSSCRSRPSAAPAPAAAAPADKKPAEEKPAEERSLMQRKPTRNLRQRKRKPRRKKSAKEGSKKEDDKKSASKKDDKKSTSKKDDKKPEEAKKDDPKLIPRIRRMTRRRSPIPRKTTRKGREKGRQEGKPKKTDDKKDKPASKKEPKRMTLRRRLLRTRRMALTRNPSRVTLPNRTTRRRIGRGERRRQEGIASQSEHLPLLIRFDDSLFVPCIADQ